MYHNTAVNEYRRAETTTKKQKHDKQCCQGDLRVREQRDYGEDLHNFFQGIHNRGLVVR